MAQAKASVSEIPGCLFPGDCCCARDAEQACTWAVMMTSLTELGRPPRRPAPMDQPRTAPRDPAG